MWVCDVRFVVSVCIATDVVVVLMILKVNVLCYWL